MVSFLLVGDRNIKKYLTKKLILYILVLLMYFRNNCGGFQVNNRSQMNIDKSNNLIIASIIGLIIISLISLPVVGGSAP